MYYYRLFSLCIGLLMGSLLYAGGIKGTIVDENGEALAFATIFVKELDTGTFSNAEGKYSYRLNPGKYTIAFQFIGYESQIKTVTIGAEYVEWQIVLKKQIYDLQF